MLKKSALITALIVLFSHALFSYADEASPTSKPNDLFNKVRKIPGPNAVEETGLISLGGIKQWVSARGRNKDNPILLFVHGGPGFTASPVSYYYMRDWEEFFTVVQWDQRGAGKTYLANDPAQIEKTMNIDQMVSDAEELVEYLRKKYNKRKIVLMAHSWGTVVGVKLAQKHPDWFYTYVGMGQFIDFERSEKMGYDQTLAMARKDNNAEAIKDLLAIAPFPDAKHPERNFQNLGTERRWLATYGGYYWLSKFGNFNDISTMSPDYSAEELQSRNVAQAYSGKLLWDEISHVNFMGVKNFKCPIIILQGRHDTGTASALVDEWFKGVNAPSKKLVWFEDASHMIYEEEPGRTLLTLVSEVLPLTR